MSDFTPQGDINLRGVYGLINDVGGTIHEQNTDTALGSGAVAADHGTESTDQIVNVCYGMGEPPEASTTTEGTIFIKYE